jgi:hypothetical protein
MLSLKIFQELKEVSNAECSLVKRFAAKGLRLNARITEQLLRFITNQLSNYPKRRKGEIPLM